MTHAGARYRGRFAPSPTGPLHLGSLVAAIASYLDARANGGEWLLRMEDLDTPRVEAGAADRILRDLETFGFEWDGPVMWQSSRTEAYREALDRLRAVGLVYPCGCSRSEVGARYAGTCARGLAPGREPRAWRIRATGEPITFDDRLRGPQSQDLAGEVGDFVLLRADGLFSYQLAVVVDDAAQGVTDIVRGADLLDSTARQIYLIRALGGAEPRYMHIPVVTDAQGNKLSKQTKAPGLDVARAGSLLCDALRFLGEVSPAGLEHAPITEIWNWATANYRAR